MLRRVLPLVVIASALPFSLLAKGPDHRLATIRTAYVVPVDDLAEDAPVAKCFAEHLPDSLPITIAVSKEDADAIFRVRANLPSATARVMVGMMGGTPSAHIDVELPDGTAVWGDGAKLRRSIGKFGKLDSSNGANTVQCGLADELIQTLRNAMKKARDSKK